MSRNCLVLTLVCSSLLFQGCANIYKTKNIALQAIDNNNGYRFSRKNQKSDNGDHVVFLSFSGGGTLSLIHI